LAAGPHTDLLRSYSAPQTPSCYKGERREGRGRKESGIVGRGGRGGNEGVGREGKEKGKMGRGERVKERKAREGRERGGRA